jgi:hypothetical protein
MPETVYENRRYWHVSRKKHDRDAMLHAFSGQIITMRFPASHLGIGNALRQAFTRDGETCSLRTFEDLIARLD